VAPPRRQLKAQGCGAVHAAPSQACHGESPERRRKPGHRRHDNGDNSAPRTKGEAIIPTTCSTASTSSTEVGATATNETKSEFPNRSEKARLSRRQPRSALSTRARGQTVLARTLASQAQTPPRPPGCGTRVGRHRPGRNELPGQRPSATHRCHAAPLGSVARLRTGAAGRRAAFPHLPIVGQDRRTPLERQDHTAHEQQQQPQQPQKHQMVGAAGAAGAATQTNQPTNPTPCLSVLYLC
jgi:hypothetical protein